MKKIAFYNNKGGVGKTTLAVNIAHGLALADYKVLLIDLDSQNDCSTLLGIEETEIEKTFFDIMDYRYPAAIEDCLINARENLDLITNSNYEIIEKDFHREPSVKNLLEEKLESLKEMNYDYLIFDCSPSISIINNAILYYVEDIVIPVQLEILSVKGIANIYDYLDNLKLDYNKIKLLIPNMFDSRTNETKENLDKLKEAFSEELLTDPVKKRIKIAECGSFGQTIWEYGSKAEKQLYPILERVVEI